MFCRNCGNKLGDGDLFCPSCGNKVEPLPEFNASDATVIADASAPNPQQSGNAYRGLLFEEREPSYNNALRMPQEELLSVQEEKTAFAPPAPDVLLAKTPLFSGNDDLIPSQPVAQPETELAPSVAEEETAFAPEQETQFEPSVRQESSEPYVMPDTSALISETEFARAMYEPSADETVIAPEEADTVIAPAQDDTVMASDEDDKTVIAPMDDSYNVYSGAVPGVTSQDFRYPTNDNAYPDLPTSIAPQFDNAVQQPDDDATVGFDYVQPAFSNQAYGAQPQSYEPQEYGNYAQNYPQQNAYDPMPVEPKKKNTAMWIIIACVSIIIIAIGATCAVILTQYDSFGDFFASFSDSKDDEDDDDDDKDKSKGDKDKGGKDKKEPQSTTTELTTELTTVEITTLPLTTVQTFDGYCGAQVYYDYDEASKTLVISGSGEMQNYANVVTPWAGKDVKRVEVGEGVTSVTPGAFTEIVPTSIYLSSTVTSFDVLAVNKFGGIEVSASNRQYKSVNSVLFDKSGTILIAYPNQKVNTSYAIPEGVKIIDELAFYEATNLNSLSISSTVEYIDNYAFKGCVNIHRLDLPANVAEIRSGVFYGWVESQDIYIANSKTKVVEDWNEGCSAEITVAT